MTTGPDVAELEAESLRLRGVLAKASAALLAASDAVEAAMAVEVARTTEYRAAYVAFQEAERRAVDARKGTE